MTAPYAPVSSPVAGLPTKQEYEQLRTQMANDRTSFLSHWRELADNIRPRRARFTVSDTNRGERRNLKIIDSTGTFSARTLASGMMTGITSPARPWFRLTTPDPDLADLSTVKDWLHQTTQRMRQVFLRSNLYNALPTVYSDMGVFGTSAMFVEEDADTVIRCRVFPVGSYYLGLDEKGEVRLWCREFRMKARQLVAQFGPDAVSTAVLAAMQGGNSESEFDVVHVIRGNPGRQTGKMDSKYKPFVSCYYEKAGEEAVVLEEKGYDEFPVFAPRWDVTDGDVYATDCPGMTALGDIKQLQFGQKMLMKAIEKHVNPPMIGPSTLRTERVSLLPADITYDDTSDPKAGLRPIHLVTPNIAGLQEEQQGVRGRIQRAFYEDLFLMLSSMENTRQPVTAAEIYARQEEKLLALGPVLEQLNQDLLNPLIDRTFAIMVRRGELPQAPPELQGVTLKVEYLSIMHAAQKASGLTQIERTANFAISLATAAQDPSILDKLDIDQAIDEYADNAGAPPRMVRPEDQVTQMRADRQKAQAAAQQAATIQAASQSAKNLSQSDTSGKNALTDLLNAAPTSPGPVPAGT